MHMPIVTTNTWMWSDVNYSVICFHCNVMSLAIMHMPNLVETESGVKYWKDYWQNCVCASEQPIHVGHILPSMSLHMSRHVMVLSWVIFFNVSPLTSDIRDRFSSLIRGKLRLCTANHRAGYFSNLTCDRLSIVWAYSEQDTENGTRYGFAD